MLNILILVIIGYLFVKYIISPIVEEGNDTWDEIVKIIQMEYKGWNIETQDCGLCLVKKYSDYRKIIIHPIYDRFEDGVKVTHIHDHVPDRISIIIQNGGNEEIVSNVSPKIKCIYTTISKLINNKEI